MSSANARVTELNDGLRVVTHYVDDMPSADIYVRVMAGSRDEVDGNHPRGTLHALEHDIAFGSEKYSGCARELIQGVTGFNDKYHEFRPTARLDSIKCDIKVPFEWTRHSLDVVGAMFSCPLLRTCDVDHERNVLQIERGANKLDVGSMENWLATYVGHGKHPRLHPVAGSKEGIGAITPDSLRRFSAQNILGGRAIVGVEGSFGHDEIVRYVENSFSLPPGLRSPSETPAYTGGDARYFLPQQEVAHLAVAFKAPTESDVHAAAAYEVAVNLLRATNHRGKHSIFDALRANLGAAYDVAIGMRRSLDAGLLVLSYKTLPELGRTSLQAVQRVISDMADGIDEDSFARVQVAEGRDFEGLRNSQILTAWRLAEDLSLHGRVLPAEYYSGLRLQVTKADVQEAARQMLAHPPTFLAVGDTNSELLPGPDEVRDIFHARQQQRSYDLAA